MKGHLFFILAVLFYGSVTGCSMISTRNEITRIIYISEAGSILPELQWYESFVIDGNKVSLTRSGKTAGTKVNTGTWEIPLDSQKTLTLFEQLKKIDCTTLKRFEPDDPPDGGDTRSYTIVYSDGQKCTLVINPGVTYSSSDLMVKPITELLQNLVLPAEAANRYSLP